MIIETLLEIQSLSVQYQTFEGTVSAVRNFSLTLQPGQVIGLVGESGCGKSSVAGAILKLLPQSCKTIADRLVFQGIDLLRATPDEMRKVRGAGIGMVFQDPMAALNPVLRIGRQLTEGLILHLSLSPQEAESRALELLTLVGIPDPTARIRQYPHQLSGGMRQRVMIAMALACNPALLIADEPTTALDVTIQAQVLELLRHLNTKLNTAILMISHNLGIIAGICDYVIVMYAGEIVEIAPTEALYDQPMHPYTWCLLGCVPRIDAPDLKLTPIDGQPPVLHTLPAGCAFAERCPFRMDICSQPTPLFPAGPERQSRCWLLHPDMPHTPNELLKERVRHE